jgi:hypothetical protein
MRYVARNQGGKDMIWMMLCLWASGKVTNVADPTDAVRYQLVKEWQLGGEDAPDNQIFTHTTNVAIGADGTVYVVDPGNFQVLIFDKDANFIRSFGRQGEGPGEFQEPVTIAVDGEGRPVVFDTGTKKMNVFSPEGKLVREARFASGVQAILQSFIFDNGNIALLEYKNDENFQFTYFVTLYDPELKPIKSMMERPTPRLDWQQAGNTSFWVDFLKDQFEVIAGGLPVIGRAGQQLVVGKTTKYEGVIYNASGEEQRQFSKEFEPRFYNDEIKYKICEDLWQSIASNPALTNQLGQPVFERAVEKTQFPDRLPPMWFVFSLGKRFGVLNNYNPLDREGRIDIFEANGKLHGTANFKGHDRFLQGTDTHLYTVGTDENDYVIIERFRLAKSGEYE